MSQYLILLLVFGLTLQAKASQKYKIHLDQNNLQSRKINLLNQEFVQLNLKDVDTDKTLGAPELPVKNWLINGTPEQVKVIFKRDKFFKISGRPSPVQEQDCRCETQKIKSIKFNADLYTNNTSPIKIQYLGAYRGQPISQVSVLLAEYNPNTLETSFAVNTEVEINKSEFALTAAKNKEFLILATPALAQGLTDFINWKQSRGYTVYIETLAAPNNTTAYIQTLIKQYYANKKISFVMIVGDENTLPMLRADTVGGTQTPSDLKYFTMDGVQDYIPDMFTSRIVASTASQVSAQLAKSIEYEQQTYGNSSGLNKFIGIASNEGSKPSDDEYIKAIEAKYIEVKKTNILHLQQSDAINSKPETLNNHLNTGAEWLTYMGHGSGTSWPSMNQPYSTLHINQMNNKSTVKPIIIDIACQNGRLVEDYLGSQFMKVDSLSANNPFGAAAYYGGSVNISWHPPAIMAQGIAYEQLTKKYTHLGEVLLAGQFYLASKWTNKVEVIDNLEWFHLQGDPSLNINK